MTTVVCDITENANAASSVKLGYTETVYQAALAQSLLVLGMTLTLLSTGSATSTVTSEKSAELLTQGNAATYAPGQLRALQLVVESAQAESAAAPTPTDAVLNTVNATSAVALSRTATLSSSANATTLDAAGARVVVTVGERAVATSFAVPANDATLTSTANATSVTAVSALRGATALASANATSLVAGARAVLGDLASSAAATSSVMLTGRYSLTISESAAAASFVPLPTRMDAWVINTETNAMSRYTSLPVQSLAVVGELTLGAGENGVYVMGGADDDGEAINGRVLTGQSELGQPVVKSLGDVVMDYSSNGALSLRVIGFNGDGQFDYTYSLPARSADSTRANRLTPGKGLRSRFYQFEFAAVGGAEFNLATASVQVAANSRRV